MSESEAPVPFETVWPELGVREEGAGDVDLDATITPHTFATSGGAAAGVAEIRTMEEGARAPSFAPPGLGLHTLPRISLAAPGEEPEAAASLRAAAGRHDLEIVGLLGEGGMGQVLLARQRSLSRDVAVKIVKPEVESPGAIEALLAEAVVTGFLEHPSIIPVHALGVDDSGRPILVMKRIEGVSWRELLRDPDHPAWEKQGAPAGDRLGAHLHILMQVASALAFAHRRGVIHRDVKPANVMVGEFGEVYLVDWGIATGVEPEGTAPAQRPLRGTPAYMAPEMVSSRAGTIDERTDVYLLGATLREVLTGRPPHEGATLFEVLHAAYASPPAVWGPDVPAELAAICDRATHPKRARRYPSAHAFRQAIAEFLEHRSSIALADEAAARLAELREALASKADPERVHRLLTECRFGFMQALREWRDNEPARRGLEECLEAMIERHLADGSAAAARGLLGELPTPRPDLERRIAALEEELRLRSERDERLKQMERDLDLDVASRQRAVVFLGLGAASLAVAVFLQRAGGGGFLNHRRMLVLSSVFLLVISAGVVLGRRQLFRNAVNRRIVAVLYIACVATLVHRVIGTLRDTSPLQIITDDMLILSAVTAVAGVTLLRWLWWVALLFLICAITCLLRPTLAPAMFSVGTAITVVLGYFMVERRKR